MNKLLIAAAVLGFAAGSQALAQTQLPGSAPPASATAKGGAGAPVGHRQPRSGDVPSEKPGSPDDPTKVSPEDAALDRKMKSICRGC